MSDALSAPTPSGGVSMGDLVLACVVTAAVSIGGCFAASGYILDNRDASLRTSLPRIVTVDEAALLKRFLSLPQNAEMNESEFETATLEWSRQFQAISDGLASTENLIILRRSNVAAGAKDLTDAIGKALYGE